MKAAARRVALCVLLALSLIAPAWPWGNEGHSAINRVAAEKLPPDMPAFLRNASAQLAWLAPEPDRWRETSELALKRSQEPDHYINLELIEGMTLPPDRYSFYRELNTKREQTPGHPDDLLPEHVGLQPYITMEVYERLVVAFREYRAAIREHRNPDFAEANAIYYAGWLGHYVGDGANPLHTTIHHNGWVGPNPKGYTTANTIHWKMEGVFVAANLQQLQFADLVPTKPQLLNNPFQDYLHYLRSSFLLVDTAYQLEKEGGFDRAGTPASRDFIRHRLAAGATMLRDMWYSAWVQSGQESSSASASKPTAIPAEPKH
ncbi:MAG: nuclease [Candidatus Korobacteraceae bacterium]